MSSRYAETFLFRIFFSFLLAFHFSACFHPVLHSSTSLLAKPHEYKEPGLGKQGLVEEVPVWGPGS